MKMQLQQKLLMVIMQKTVILIRKGTFLEQSMLVMLKQKMLQDQKKEHIIFFQQVEIEKNLLSHGITKDTKVVLYGGDISGTARVAYAYIWAGVEDVKIVNGGIDAWKKAGYETEKRQTKEQKQKISEQRYLHIRSTGRQLKMQKTKLLMMIISNW